MTPQRRWLVHAAVIAFLLGVALVSAPAVEAECEPTEIGPNTPTGIMGCERWGNGTASMYGPGDGVAMNFCTWTVRHTEGCGVVAITSMDTGAIVTAPVVDYCDCFTGTSDERIVDLQYGVVAALGLNPAAGLWPVRVDPMYVAEIQSLPNTAVLP